MRSCTVCQILVLAAETGGTVVGCDCWFMLMLRLVLRCSRCCYYWSFTTRVTVTICWTPPPVCSAISTRCTDIRGCSVVLLKAWCKSFITVEVVYQARDLSCMPSCYTPYFLPTILSLAFYTCSSPRKSLTLPSKENNQCHTRCQSSKVMKVRPSRVSQLVPRRGRSCKHGHSSSSWHEHLSTMCEEQKLVSECAQHSLCAVTSTWLDQTA